jgi:hypothetical protein
MTAAMPMAAAMVMLRQGRAWRERNGAGHQRGGTQNFR